MSLDHLCFSNNVIFVVFNMNTAIVRSSGRNSITLENILSGYVRRALWLFFSGFLVVLEFSSFTGFSSGTDNIPQCQHHLLSKKHILNLKHVISWEFYNWSGINTSYFCWEVMEADISLKSLYTFYLEILSDCIKLPFLWLHQRSLYSFNNVSFRKPFCCSVPFYIGFCSVSSH